MNQNGIPFDPDFDTNPSEQSGGEFGRIGSALVASQNPQFAISTKFAFFAGVVFAALIAGTVGFLFLLTTII